MDKKKFEELYKKVEDWVTVKQKTPSEITEQLHKELSEEDFREFTNLYVKRVIRKTKKILKKHSEEN